MKNALKIFTALLLILSLTACSEREIVTLPVADDYNVVAGATPSDKLRVGLIPGSYSDMFTEIIQPLLENMGYSLEIIHYDGYALPNISLTQNQIDLNMYQHYKSLNKYKFENDAALSAIAEVPTAPMVVFSSVYDSLQDIEDGAAVSVPAESAELSRALTALENAGLISLGPVMDKSNVTLDDIAVNPYDLKFAALQSEDLVQSLPDYELSVVDGSRAFSDNLSLSNAIYREVMNEDYLIVVAVRSDDLHAQFVSDIIEIINSPEYKAAISAEGGKFANYQRPPSFYK